MFKFRSLGIDEFRGFGALGIPPVDTVGLARIVFECKGLGGAEVEG